MSELNPPTYTCLNCGVDVYATTIYTTRFCPICGQDNVIEALPPIGYIDDEYSDPIDELNIHFDEPPRESRRKRK